MPSRAYSIVEPHPTANPKSYIPTGRGGAGNFSRAPSSVTRGTDASGPASHYSSLSSHSSTAKAPFMTGRGGAGNVVHFPSERAIFSFDEELERQLRMESGKAPVYHVGRGGAGNVYGRAHDEGQRREFEVRRKSASDDSESAKSDGSARSAESGAELATRKMKQGWKKIVGVH